MEYSNNSNIIKERLIIAHNQKIAKIRGDFFNSENLFFKKNIRDCVVLVAGSGLGQDAIELSKYNQKVIGIDIVPEFVDYSLKNSKGISNLDFVVGDIKKINFPNKYFDISILNMGTIGDFDNKFKILKELLRVSKKVYFDFYPPENVGLEIRKKMYIEEGWKNVVIKDNALISDDGLYSKSISKEFFVDVANKLDSTILFYQLNEFSVMACLFD